MTGSRKAAARLPGLLVQLARHLPERAELAAQAARHPLFKPAILITLLAAASRLQTGPRSRPRKRRSDPGD